MHGRLNFLCPDLLRVTTTRAGLAVPFGVIGSRDGQFAVSLFMKIVIPAMELTALPELGAVKIQTIRSFASCEAAAMFSDHCMMYLTRKLYQQPNLESSAALYDENALLATLVAEGRNGARQVLEIYKLCTHYDPSSKWFQVAPDFRWGLAMCCDVLLHKVGWGCRCWQPARPWWWVCSLAVQKRAVQKRL